MKDAISSCLDKMQTLLTAQKSLELSLVKTTLEEFENEVFTLKTHQVFSVHTTSKEFKAQQSLVILDSFLTKPRAGKSHNYHDATIFEKFRFQNVILPHKNEKPAFSNSSGLKSVFEKLRFRDRLVWMEILTVEIKLRFQISPAFCERCLITYLAAVYLEVASRYEKILVFVFGGFVQFKHIRCCKIKLM